MLQALPESGIDRVAYRRRRKEPMVVVRSAASAAKEQHHMAEHFKTVEAEAWSLSTKITVGIGGVLTVVLLAWLYV
jgi:hypothetical protein